MLEEEDFAYLHTAFGFDKILLFSPLGSLGFQSLPDLDVDA